jgi:DNA-directed RNA polymerase subunit beta'
MLASHNILNPANGAPITVPSQDMVLGLYYITKGRKGSNGEGLTFYSPEEVKIAYNEKKIALSAIINVRVDDLDEDGIIVKKVIETTTGRVLFNDIVPKEVGFINELLTKKSVRGIIANVLDKTNTAVTADFLDNIKHMGFNMAYKGGLSFNLDDVIIPDEKESMIQEGYQQVDEVFSYVVCVA